ncbi:MAG: bifunctional 5,10-methylenetetrahydrofolate dehydrogenase/5,10-methenyltetrahydrofolate cyclohydrolase [Spirochaetia bacterium]|nr:bifunctional 5,10-methylenetetrahydrofolate dehydrogenase/5,10-methenyltetrahydrofolate cyclohydrolase [Spirochaetia bacterium]
MIEIPSFKIPKEDWVEDKLLYGKKLAVKIREHLKERVEKTKIRPGLAALLVGEDEASKIYVSSKEKAANEIGFHSVVKKLPVDATQEEVLAVVHEWNNDENIHGILVQLPLPKHINSQNILQSINASKDADGFHYANMGRLMAKEKGAIACTPLGIIVMLKELGVNTEGKHALVLGRSNIVGKPMAQLLLDAAQCTVTVCHSKSRNIDEMTASADILVAAMGVRDVIDYSKIKKDAIVIDVGMHRIDGKVKGDLDYKEILDKVSFITPVPGGVGPMTIAMLLYNTYQNAVWLNEKDQMLA